MVVFLGQSPSTTEEVGGRSIPINARVLCSGCCSQCSPESQRSKEALLYGPADEVHRSKQRRADVNTSPAGRGTLFSTPGLVAVMVHLSSGTWRCMLHVYPVVPPQLGITSNCRFLKTDLPLPPRIHRASCSNCPHTSVRYLWYALKVHTQHTPLHVYPRHGHFSPFFLTGFFRNVLCHLIKNTCQNGASFWVVGGVVRHYPPEEKPQGGDPACLPVAPIPSREHSSPFRSIQINMPGMYVRKDGSSLLGFGGSSCIFF